MSVVCAVCFVDYIMRYIVQSRECVVCLLHVVCVVLCCLCCLFVVWDELYILGVIVLYIFVGIGNLWSQSSVVFAICQGGGLKYASYLIESSRINI